MGDFKEIMVVEAGIDAFVELVIGYRVEHFSVDPTSVVSMNHLPHKPKILLHGLGFAAQLFHKAEVQHIGAVQTDPVNIKFLDPKSVLHQKDKSVQRGGTD